MRHVNPNMIPSVLQGIESGEDFAGHPGGDTELAFAYDTLERMMADLRPKGDRPFVVSGFLKAKDIASLQGFIAAYRSATEHPPRGSARASHDAYVRSLVQTGATLEEATAAAAKVYPSCPLPRSEPDMRYLLIHIDDAAAEDALSAVLLTATEHPATEEEKETAVQAISYLNDHIHKIHVGLSAIVPKAAS